MLYHSTPPVVKRSLEITVNDGTTAISGASVTIGEDTETTNASGKASFELADGTYSATVTKTGYANKTSSITINGADTTATISLDAVDTITITVDDGEDSPTAIEGATVKIGTATKTTNSSGVATFENMTYDDYSAEISAEGYTTKTETLQFRSNHKSFTISLVAAENTEQGTG